MPTHLLEAPQDQQPHAGAPKSPEGAHLSADRSTEGRGHADPFTEADGQSDAAADVRCRLASRPMLPSRSGSTRLAPSGQRGGLAAEPPELRLAAIVSQASSQLWRQVIRVGTGALGK